MKTYKINEIFYSVQGEGIRMGTPNIFIRFSGCNLACSKNSGPRSPGGFDCDTEFVSGRSLSLDEIAEWVEVAFRQNQTGLKWVDWIEPRFILTGGEPALQVDNEFISYWKSRNVKFAIETNGSIDVSHLGLDWITVSPKVAEHAIRQKKANEVKYVRGYGQAIPRTVVEADYFLISPAFDGQRVHPDTLSWCIKLVLENPTWRLSLQSHKFIGVR